MRLKKVTDEIAKAMKAGQPPWRKPVIFHENAGFPTNAYTERTYCGINPLLLNLASMKQGFRSKYWATFKQWQGLGCQVKQRPPDVHEGAWSTRTTRMEGNEENDDRIPRQVSLFNADQVFGNFHLKPASAYQVFGQIAEPKVTVTEFREVLAKSNTGQNISKDQAELVLEIGLGHLELILGLPHSCDLTNYFDWLGKWLQAMDDDPRYIYEAANHADKLVLDVRKKLKVI